MKRIVKTGTYTDNGVEKIFSFYTTLRAVDKINFINFVTNVVVGDNYYSTIHDMIFDFEIIDIMTDIDVSDIKNSDDVVSAIEDFLERTNIVEIVKANAKDGLIEELNKGVNDNIEYHTGIHKNSIEESLSHLLNVLEDKISSIDTESMINMAQAISGVSEELTVDKFIEAYAKSDMFKEKYAQMIADREKHNEKIEANSTAVKNTRKNGKKTTSAK
jgi:hypothetical protein